MEGSGNRLKEKSVFESIDLVKFLCSILVVGIHVPLFGASGTPVVRWLNYGINRYIGRLAVPFFFMCTGFLLFRKKTKHSELSIGIKYAMKIYRLYLIWTLLHLYPIGRYIMSYPGGIVVGVCDFVRHTVFIGSYMHLWYINASAFAVLLVSVLLHKGMSVKRIVGVSLMLYLIGMLPQSYYGLFRKLEAVPPIWEVFLFLERIMETTRNGLFMGFFFVSLGMFLARVPMKFTLKGDVVGFLAFMLIWLIEILGLTKLNWIREKDMYVFLVPSVFFLFRIVLNIELKSRSIYIYLREMSVLVYFLHLWVEYGVNGVYGSLNLPASMPDLRGLLTVVASIAAAFCIVHLSRCKGFGWLKKLYA